MKKIFLLFVFLQSLSVFSQDLTCADFKEGTFKSIVEKPVKIEFEIIRKGNFQTERALYVPEEFKDVGSLEKIYAKIKWLSNCSYKLTYDETKGKLNESQKMINKLGGLLTEVTKIEGRCFYYKSSMKINGQEVAMEGKLCKE